MMKCFGWIDRVLSQDNLPTGDYWFKDSFGGHPAWVHQSGVGTVKAMRKRGWITNDRKPVITAKGREAQRTGSHVK